MDDRINQKLKLWQESKIKKTRKHIITDKICLESPSFCQFFIFKECWLCCTLKINWPIKHLRSKSNKSYFFSPHSLLTQLKWMWRLRCFLEVFSSFPSFSDVERRYTFWSTFPSELRRRPPTKRQPKWPTFQASLSTPLQCRRRCFLRLNLKRRSTSLATSWTFPCLTLNQNWVANQAVRAN